MTRTLDFNNEVGELRLYFLQSTLFQNYAVGRKSVHRMQEAMPVYCDARPQ
ncbi:hypothetical protein XBKB1_2620002 [Xenorhabdus bovienii str. kraussei Becker Underwood]|uniref:Uncharacterized protein n=1 Tax=Xenorhabdus bovienii str. kraussei Becker Underwood TaxID=1398204 RepID=A0A077PWQ8_XENBV|nr:hypothetical protein XBKB1_2620002 [Xenorhabdus bovienii str. kraussei Becker Underwood]